MIPKNARVLIQHDRYGELIGHLAEDYNDYDARINIIVQRRIFWNDAKHNRIAPSEQISIAKNDSVVIVRLPKYIDYR